VRICVFEDAGVAGLAPLTLTRPAFDLRCGARTLLQRQLRFFGADRATAVLRPELADYCRFLHPEMTVNEPVPRGPVAYVNARWLPPSNEGPLDRPAAGLIGEEVAFAVAGGEEATAENLPRRLAERALAGPPAGGALLAHPWDLLEHNAAALEQDLADWDAEHATAPIPRGVTVQGPAERVRIDPAARVEPMTLLDVADGPVMIDRGAVVQAFSRLVGPCYVGPDTRVLGAKLSGSAVGPNSRVGGEVEETIFQGYANKAHDGFLGHSYVGEWVNLGAGTQVSDLRTDYGTVEFRRGGRPVDSGRMKVGAFFGDHAKTSIGVLINTGSIIGPFSQLLASGELLPRTIPAFCRYGHGRLAERTDLREMFETAAVAMGRRGQEWTEEHAEFFLGLYERTADERRHTLREAEQKRLRRVV
jgi:UDP-N-acetylglucosamine diphosphorylase/glucosamine-1-phosphate N-acetyltransferase